MLRTRLLFFVTISSLFLSSLFSFTGQLGLDQEFVLFAEFFSILLSNELSCISNQTNSLIVICLLLSRDNLFIDLRHDSNE